MGNAYDIACQNVILRTWNAVCDEHEPHRQLTHAAKGDAIHASVGHRILVGKTRTEVVALPSPRRAEKKKKKRWKRNKIKNVCRYALATKCSWPAYEIAVKLTPAFCKSMKREPFFASRLLLNYHISRRGP